VKNLFLHPTFILRTDTAESWRFANSDLIPATGIMVFGRSVGDLTPPVLLYMYLYQSIYPSIYWTSVRAAFMCHHNTFLVYQSMRDATMERWEKVTHISIGFAWTVAALFGIAGYSTFRALSQGEGLTQIAFNCPDRQFADVPCLLFSGIYYLFTTGDLLCFILYYFPR